MYFQKMYNVTYKMFHQKKDIARYLGMCHFVYKCLGSQRVKKNSKTAKKVDVPIYGNQQSFFVTLPFQMVHEKCFALSF